MVDNKTAQQEIKEQITTDLGDKEKLKKQIQNLYKDPRAPKGPNFIEFYYEPEGNPDFYKDDIGVLMKFDSNQMPFEVALRAVAALVRKKFNERWRDDLDKHFDDAKNVDLKVKFNVIKEQDNIIDFDFLSIQIKFLENSIIKIAAVHLPSNS